MSELETIDASNWEEFLSSPAAVLMLGKSDCQACKDWTQELTAFLGSEDNSFKTVRFGKMLLDQRGLIEFKKQSPWLAGLDVLPFNAIYHNGEKVNDFAGSGIERMSNRLKRILSPS